MKKLIIIVATLGIATAAWAGHGHDGTHGGHHNGKHHFGKMMFEKMDKNDDGVISVREHEAGLQKMLEKRRAHFAKMDADGDGLVTKEEAREAHKEMAEKRREHRQEHKKD